MEFGPDNVINKLSHSSVTLYTQCSYCYYLKYIEGIRPKRQNSALFFGKALDDAFNTLLLEKDLGKAKDQFKDSWGKLADTPMKFRKTEIDDELLEFYLKKSENELGQKLYSHPNKEWHTLYFKGMLFIEAYYNQVLPKIKEVIAVQESFSFPNSEGDEINGIIDLIVKWEDGKTYLLDNKTSSYKYGKNDAKESPQLSLYHYIISDKYKLDGIGFIVLNKNIRKNKIMTCKDCGGKTTNNRLKTCAQDLGIDGHRCNGEFTVEMSPSVDVSFILDNVDKSTQEKVVDMFDKANVGISNNLFAKTHNKEFSKYGPCEYYYYTPTNPDFYKKEKK